MNSVIVAYVDTLYIEGGTRSNRWMSIDIVFQKKNGEYIRHKFFAPETYRERRQISAYFRNLFDVLDVDYNAVEYHYEWYSLAATFKELLREKEGVQLYAKIITRKDREQLGLTLPVLSKKDDLQYSPEEMMFMVNAYEPKKEEAKIKQGISQKEMTKRKLSRL